MAGTNMTKYMAVPHSQFQELVIITMRKSVIIESNLQKYVKYFFLDDDGILMTT